MFCKYCGHELTDDAHFCANCGANLMDNGNVCQTNTQSDITKENVKEEGKALGVCAIVFSVLGGWIGLVLSIVGLSSYKVKSRRAMCWVGLGLSIFWIVVGICELVGGLDSNAIYDMIRIRCL